jgi:broad specificity phosphatase PhoE
MNELRGLRRRLRRFRPDHLYSSDLRRCRDTARLLAPELPLITNPALRELHFGRWEGLRAADCERLHPARFRRWMRDPERTCPPGGESLRALRSRVHRFVAGLARRHPGRTVALVTHAGPIRVLLARSPEEFWIPEVPPGSLFTVDWR